MYLSRIYEDLKSFLSIYGFRPKGCFLCSFGGVKFGVMINIMNKTRILIDVIMPSRSLNRTIKKIIGKFSKLHIGNTSIPIYYFLIICKPFKKSEIPPKLYGKLVHEVNSKGIKLMIIRPRIERHWLFYFVEPDRGDRTGKILIDLLRGHKQIIVIDPYLNRKAIDLILNATPTNANIILITIKTKNGSHHKLVNHIKKYYQNRLVNLYTTTKIHDRYIITPTHLIFIGHSIKDLGKKFSTIIAIPKTPTITNKLKEYIQKILANSSLIYSQTGVREQLIS